MLKLALEEAEIVVEHEDGVFHFSKPNPKQFINIARLVDPLDRYDQVFALLTKVENVEVAGEVVDAEKFRSMLPQLPPAVVLQIYVKAHNQMLGVKGQEAEPEKKT